MRPFGRIVTAAIGQAGANGAALLGFRTSFDVKYSGSSTPGKGTIRVWNVPQTLISTALSGPLPSCMLTAGHYEADTGVPLPALPLIMGDVTDYRVKASGVDTVLEMECLAAGFAWQRARFVFTSVASSSYSALIPLAVGSAGLVMRSLAPGRDVPLPLGAYVDEPFQSFMDRAVAATASKWRVADGKFVDVWPAALPNPSAFAAVFDPANTIGLPAVKDKTGVELRGLLNGKIRPGSSFTVIGEPTRPGLGTYITTDVAFVGDSGFDNAYYVDVVGKLAGT